MIKEKSLLRAFFGTAGLQLIGRGLTVITGILFARTLGPAEFGRYSFVLSVIAFAVLPAVAGIPQLIIRETARYVAEQQHALMLGMWKWSNRYILALSGLSMIVLYGLVYLDIWPSSMGILIVSALMLIPFRGMLARQTAIINGLRRPELAQFPMLIIAPLIALCIVGYLFLSDYQLSSQRLIYIQLTTHALGVVLSYLLLKHVAKSVTVTGKAQFQVKRWQKALLPFTVLTIVGTMNNELATLFLGVLGSEEAIGYFKVAMQGITLLALGLQAVNTVSGPRIAGLYRQNKIEETQKLLTQSVKLSVLSSVPFALLLIIFGEELVSLLFGRDYLPAAGLLTILCVGQIVNVCMGSVGLVLNMTGNERSTLRAQFITLALTVVLLLTLIPLFQATGAAIAVSVGLVSWNVIMAFDVYRLTGLKTWIRV
ncbi:oligosaccharide flippase family protein [Vibrio breoganii]|uniref:oligosaccharide flippase family protein n=1 Tax=Vibrio breoganii TaxID=553239 RepID=UPI000C84E645|nr:oligosaccharide flippase family protein [Vibrio breoganii]